MQNALLIEQSEALAMMATASAADRDTMSNLVTSKYQLSTHLAERSAALATANETIHSLRSVSSAIGGSAYTSAARYPSNGTARVHPATNNENYCWSHGYQIHADHTSMTCTRRAEGHQELATKANNMGGRQWDRNAARQAGAAIKQDKQIKHYNHCLPYTGCTPIHKHISIVDLGCTGHYIMVTVPVTNKKVATMPIQVTLTDGAFIKSSHTCELILPQLPKTAKKAHVIPGLSTSSLLSVGKLVDAGCSVIFDKTKVQILHKKTKSWKDRGPC
jgi:hypothetical protein